MSIIGMVEALNTAYVMAYKEMFSDSTNDDILEAVHFACKIDCDDVAQYDSYLRLTPSNLEILYNLVRSAIIYELTKEQDSMGPRLMKRIARLFGIVVEIKFK